MFRQWSAYETSKPHAFNPTDLYRLGEIYPPLQTRVASETSAQSTMQQTSHLKMLFPVGNKSERTSRVDSLRAPKYAAFPHDTVCHSITSSRIASYKWHFMQSSFSGSELTCSLTKPGKNANTITKKTAWNPQGVRTLV
jgi:hypothetical protein